MTCRPRVRIDPFLAGEILAAQAVELQFTANCGALLAGWPVDPLSAGLEFLRSWHAAPPALAARTVAVLTRW